MCDQACEEYPGSSETILKRIILTFNKSKLFETLVDYVVLLKYKT
jgi:hypothetical protein